MKFILDLTVPLKLTHRKIDVDYILEGKMVFPEDYSNVKPDIELAAKHIYKEITTLIQQQDLILYKVLSRSISKNKETYGSVNDCHLQVKYYITPLEGWEQKVHCMDNVMTLVYTVETIEKIILAKEEKEIRKALDLEKQRHYEKRVALSKLDPLSKNYLKEHTDLKDTIEYIEQCIAEEEKLLWYIEKWRALQGAKERDLMNEAMKMGLSWHKEEVKEEKEEKKIEEEKEDEACRKCENFAFYHEVDCYYACTYCVHKHIPCGDTPCDMCIQTKNSCSFEAESGIKIYEKEENKD